MSGRLFKKIAGPLLLITGGTLAGLLLAEITLVLFLPQQIRVTGAVVNFFVQYDPDLGWMNRKGAAGELRPPDDSLSLTQIRINSEGFRGKEVRLPKPKGGKRILFLGDSNTFGYGVNEDARFSNLLENRLTGYDTVNLGVFGYGTDQEAILFEREGLRFAPDLVVAAFSAGDLNDNRSSIDTGVSKPYCTLENGQIKLNNVPVPQPGSRTLMKQGSLLRETLYRNSHLYRLLAETLKESRVFMPDSVFELTEGEGMQVTVAVLEGMNRVCRENGSRFAVLLLSHGAWIDASAKNRQQDVGYYPVMARILASRGIAVIDTTERFIEETAKGRRLFFDRDPVHLNSEGNRIVAEVLHDGLVRFNLIQ
jgi:lysophospholipase L1-like esterase